MRHFFDSIGFGLNSLVDFEDEQLAGRVISRIVSAPRELSPTRFGPYEPLKPIPESADPLIDAWLNVDGRKRSPAGGPQESLLLLERSSKVGYMAAWRKAYAPSFPYVSGHAPISSLQTKPGLFESWLELVKDLVTIVNPIYGEIRNRSFPGWDTPKDLQKRLPDIPWVSIYGEPYISFFGQQQIESAPFCKIEKLTTGHYWLVASGSVFDVVSEEVRDRIRRHLGVESFMSGRKRRYKDGDAPTFDFSKVVIAPPP